MGDPRKIKRKLSKPSHPWRIERITEEHQLAKEFGLRRMREIWKGKTFLADIAYQAKRLIPLKTPQAGIEKARLLTRLNVLGILPQTALLTDVLSLTVRDILRRRLQTFVVQKKLARSTRQARQFISHEHIIVKNKVVSSPSYLVLRDEEDHITFAQNSALANADHPERAIPEKAVVGKAEKVETK